MNSSDQVYEKLENVFMYKNFKSPTQEEAVMKVVFGNQDVYVSLPTGAGKSLIYQLPAVIATGITIVVSPLLALIEDQVEALQALGIQSATLNSKLSASERRSTKDALLKPNPELKLLYVTPELLQTPGFSSTLEKLNKRNNLAFFAVDEAHCVSQWGHDFRPDYLKLGVLRKKFHNVHWIALTATATPRVQHDIISSLHLHEPVAIFKNECYRPNLFYDLRFKELLDCPVDDMVEYVKSILTRNKQNTLGETGIEKDCGIVYCRTRESCETMAAKLLERGIKAKAYHAGLRPDARNDAQQEWMDGTISVIVATVSFGMGIDKAPVRFVIHWTMPQSVEGYYQESGRAGRDGKKAYCRIYYSRQEREQILFLLKKDANNKRMKGKNHKAQAIKASFNSLVDYCEQPRCRHAFIAEYFGDTKPECGKGCDFCRNRKEVELMVEQWRDGVIANKKMTGYSKTFMCAGFDQPDETLYGGGRYSADRYPKALDDNSCDSDEGNDGLSEIIQDEFKKRRGKRKKRKLDHTDIPATISRVKQAENFTHIPKLPVKVREHCLGLLEKALTANFKSSNRSPQTVEQLAIDMEYGVFLANKSSQMYKLNTQQKVKEIGQSTDRKELFFGSVREPEIAVKVDQETPQNLVHAIVKAGEFVLLMHGNECNSRQSKGTVVGLFRLRSMQDQLMQLLEEIPLPLITAPQVSQVVDFHSNFKTSVFVKASDLSTAMSSATSHFETRPPTIVPGMAVGLPSPAVCSSRDSLSSCPKSFTTCKTVSSEEYLNGPASATVHQMISKTDTAGKLDFDLDIPPLPPLPRLTEECKPTLPSFENKTNSSRHVSSLQELPVNTLIPSDPRISPCITENLNCGATTPTSNQQCQRDYLTSGSSVKLPSNEPDAVIVCSSANSNQFSHEMQPTVPPSHEHHTFTTVPGRCVEQELHEPADQPCRDGKRGLEEKQISKKDCANIIVKYLSPYYKSGQVESKVMFKALAREMTEKLVEDMGNLREEKLKFTAKSLVKMYIEQKKKSSNTE